MAEDEQNGYVAEGAEDEQEDGTYLVAEGEWNAENDLRKMNKQANNINNE